MGSGWQASEGWTKAAFIRNIRNQSDLAGNMVANTGSTEVDAPVIGGADPYTIQLSTAAGNTWGTYLFCGGPRR
jgi:hypothetical protein